MRNGSSSIIRKSLECSTRKLKIGGLIPPLGTSRTDGECACPRSPGPHRKSERVTPPSILDLSTPALVLDRRRLERNAARFRDKVRELGVLLRPHVKTS